jgi:adenine-specific DNA-methyltransferase
MTIDQQIPHIIKYMGSKRNILDFVVNTIQEIDPACKMRLYDIFAGSSVVGGAFRNIRPVTCNDIQLYSSVIGQIYLQNYNWEETDIDSLEEFYGEVCQESERIKGLLSDYIIDYSLDHTFNYIQEVEENHRGFINREFNGFEHLFIQKFSGTYWSLEQCIDIDATITVLKRPKYSVDFFKNLVLGALMFSMAYCSQSTGHYAQYRDLTEDNIQDILIYRKKSLLSLFEKKLYSLSEYFDGENNSDFDHQTTNEDFLDSILNSKKNSIIYADPPYQFVHYSRFYHALETLVRYDYPEVKYKGRYRTDRHQSPFCIRTKVQDAFKSMFEAVVKKNSTLIISYSDNGMISMEDLISCGKLVSDEYSIEIREMDYLHSTMGRQKDKYRKVKEVLLIYKK